MSIIKDSRLPDEWVRKVVADNPPFLREDGIITTGPVRLSFVELWEPAKAKNSDSDVEKYSCTALFTPLQTDAVWQIIWPVLYNAAKGEFPNNFDTDGQPFGLHFPLHDQREKPQYKGYQAGALYFATGSQYKPTIVDAGFNPIVDPKRLYSGVWAILACNPYTYNNKKKGVSLGLQSVMLIADDEVLGGGGIDPKAAFSHAKVSANYDPAGAFGAAPAKAGGVPLPPGAVLPPAQPVAQENMDDLLG